MRLAHISDLHLGKTLYNYPLMEDQEYILEKIAAVLVERHVDVLLIAGDVYDRNVAPESGIKVLRKFLNRLVEAGIRVLIISGNHDSAERLTFGGEFMTEKGIFFSKPYDGTIEPVTLTDAYGPVNFYLLPFIKPSIVQHYFEDDRIETYEDAVRCAVRHMHVNAGERNVILAHQNILSARRCESEENIIGGLDAVSDAVFSEFDYTALGHIHSLQKIGKNNVYFCGTPLKYSISEFDQEKKMPLVTLGEKGRVDVDTVPLIPKRDLRKIRGTFDEIMRMAKNDPNNHEDFIDITLTDENEIMDAMANLRTVYPNVLRLSYDNAASRASESTEKDPGVRGDRPLNIFEEFYKSRRGSGMSDEQKSYMQSLIERIWGEDE